MRPRSATVAPVIAAVGGLLALVLLVAGGFLWLGRSSGGRPSGAAAGPVKGALAEVPTAPQSTAPPEAVRYVTPGGAGARDGTSWEDAGRLGDVPTLVAGLPAGGEVWVRADLGPYRPGGELTFDASAGTDGTPITIRGTDVSGAPLPAQIIGQRADPYTPGAAAGRELFRLDAGANYLRFTDLDVSGMSSVFRIRSDVTGLEIENVDATNMRRFVDGTAGTGIPTANVVDLVVRNVTMTRYSKNGIWLRYNSHDLLIEDVVGDSARQPGDDYTVGVHFDDSVHNVVLRRVAMHNSDDQMGDDYWNGDGFATEGETHDIRFEDTSANGNTDAGYDLKSYNIVMIGATAADNKRNFRFWGQNVVVEDCVGSAPHSRGGTGSQAQVWAGDEATVTMSGCDFSDDSTTTVVFHVEEQASVQVEAAVEQNASADVAKVEENGQLVLNGEQVG